MKNFLKSNAWVLMILIFILAMVAMYKIVDIPELIDAAVIRPDDIEDDLEQELYFDDLENLALATMAECGYTDDSCIRATCDTMINRVYDSGFPDTFYGVFSQPGQYETFRQYYSINPTDRVYTICREQMEYFWEHGETQHPGALYFRTKHFHSFGTPLYQIGPHFFSGR